MTNFISFKNKLLSLLLLIVMSLSSCFYANNVEEKKISIVCTAFSQYDFVREIVGEKYNLFDITYLFDNGADVHSFENDVGFDSKIKILNSDLFIYNGGESDNWVEGIVNDSSKKKNSISVSMLEMIETESLIKNNHEDEHHHNNSHTFDEKSFSQYDEHVWLSLPLAIKICEKITDYICQLDIENETFYRENSQNYCSELRKLHQDNLEVFSNIENPYVVVSDRFPFAYVFKDYNIQFSAAFSGCSTETSATYENVINLCNVVSEKKLKYLVVLENSNSDISDSISSSINQTLEVVKINSLQSVSSEDIENGVSYFKTIKNNLEMLKKACLNK